MKCVACLVAALLASVSVAGAAVPVKLPEFFQLCPRNIADFDLCVKQAVQVIVPKLSRGVPELELPSLDPMRVQELSVNYNEGGIKVKSTVKNTDTYGLSQLRILNVESNITDTQFYMEIDVKFPRIYIEGDYKVVGQIVAIPVNSKGYFNISMADLSATWKLNGEFETQDGEKYLKLQEFKMRPLVGSMEVYASNLFPGVPELNEAVLRFSNRFWRVIYEEALPYVEEGWSEIMTATANKIFSKVPYDQLVPVA